MGYFFGTDGIRGIANKDLDAELAFKTGRAAAFVLTEKSGRRAHFLIGKDTRISSDMLEAALQAGICSTGADVELLGVVPTPAVAYLTALHGADAGIVISASHNPFEYNGIKIFDSSGYKLSDSLEEQIEFHIRNGGEIGKKTGAAIGRVKNSVSLVAEQYTDHLASCIDGDLSGIRVAVDCANGAASAIAPLLFKKLSLDAAIINNTPDGININDRCGSTELSGLRRYVREGGFDAGVAFDGDADRCLLVDETGQVLDGDKILAVCARSMNKQRKLAGNALVATVLSNLGLHAYARENGIRIETCNVGDRFVLEKMKASGLVLGGEQSGHVIFLDHATTGDGELTAVKFLDILKKSGCSASDLAGGVPEYPQIMVNVKTPNAQKMTIADDPLVKAAIEEQVRLFGDEGRVLVRPSGTEALVRVMVEGRESDMVRASADLIASTIRTALKQKA